jgi:hypothetical protein
MGGDSFWRETCSIQLQIDLFPLVSWAETLLCWCYPFETVVFHIVILVASQAIAGVFASLA